jgi:CHAT domain-containing protein
LSLVNEGRVSDEAWGLFETAVHLAIKKNDLPQAFTLAERARMRSLAESRRLPISRTLPDVEATLAKNEAIIALNQFEDELAIWVIRRSGTEVVTRQLSRHDAQRLIARQQTEIWQEAATAEAGRVLYNEILRPLAGHLAHIDRLVVVPDSTYESVAFTALWDASTQHFLVEKAAVNVEPSVSAFVASRAYVKTSLQTQPLVFGGVSESAVRDAQAVAATYPSAAVVAGRTATRTSFFANLSTAGHTVHIADPVAVSASNPLLSRAIVADDPGAPHSGAILGRDIANSTLANTSLVVIDEVANDSSIRGEGTLSMARAFMAAGVPAVVGTLPGADETATRDLLIAFHREMSNGVSAEQALHTVQRNAIQQNGRRLGAWSALVLYGSDR